MTTAIYARKSTDQSGVSDDQKSVARQIARAKQYAERRGWQVDDRYVFADDGISGAEFDARPGYMALMAALQPAPPFSILVMAEVSRLGRESIQTMNALRSITRAGVRVFDYMDDREMSIGSMQDNTMMFLRAEFAAEERRKAAQRTYDAMQRKAQAGHVTGGRTFGYENRDVLDAAGKHSHVERRIKEPEAAIVRRIFELRAAGHGLKAIAKTLNVERAVSPRPQRGRPQSWTDSSVREVLIRDLYRGVIVWNKTKKRDADGRVRQRRRPAEERIEIPAPELTIVNADLWTRAHRSMDADRQRYAGRFGGGWAPGARGSYLLTGLATCAVCGGGIQVQTRSHGTKRTGFYACPRSYHAACTNRTAIRVDAVDAAVLSAIECAVLSPDVTELAIDQATRRITQRKAGTAKCDAEIKRLQREIDRFVAALANGEASPTIAKEIRIREEQKAAYEAERSARQRLTVRTTSPATVRQSIAAKMSEWRECLRAEPAAARRLIGRLIDGRLTFTPQTDSVGESYDITGTATLAELFEGKTLLEMASPTGTDVGACLPVRGFSDLDAA